MIPKRKRLKLLPMLRYLPQLATIVEAQGWRWDLHSFLTAAKCCADNPALAERNGIPTNETRRGDVAARR